MFKKILVANRGEIALRIVRACKELNITSMVAYAPIDRDGLWVRKADEALELEGFQGRDGYLSIEAILSCAKRAKADAIHPGYGFLSESAEFSRSCQEKGIQFIGPTSKSMQAAGDKTKARRLAGAIGIPIIAGTEPLANAKAAEQAGKQLGYPVVLKAVAGGGGRGMRLVHSPSQMKESFESAAREALAGFGNGSLYLEKYLIKPRHIEIQILADHHGNAIHLGERECSVQRRYQKLIEEAPSPFMDDALRQKMGEGALLFAKKSGYSNAGTVEFLVDEHRAFYFLEMNARLQVEHPVTEMVAGLDLVQAQIQIAGGKTLPWRQEEIRANGCALEARINCEDPFRDFLPSPGRITHLEIPGGPFVRVDSALYAGYEIPEAFDSLIAKLVVCGPTRPEAIARMNRALQEFTIGGIPSTLPFHLQIFNHSAFKKGLLSTRFLQDYSDDLTMDLTEEEIRAAAIAAALASHKESLAVPPQSASNRWSQAGRLENPAFPLP